jgi:mono/diheme cytochrome c family protein
MRNLTLGVLFACVAMGATAAEYTPPKGDAKAGQAAFLKLGCYSCHGGSGQGTGRDGPRINPPLPYPALLQQLRTPRYEMPPYTVSQVSDSGVADIYAYLASLPKPPDVKTIGALQ